MCTGSDRSQQGVARCASWGHSRSRVRVGAALAGIALVASACTGAGARGKSAAGGVVTYPLGEYVLPSQMANVNPFALTGNWVPLFQYLYNQLFYFNPVNGKLVPELATKGQWNSSHTVYTVSLNAHAKWQDGSPVTAADVVYTYDLLHKYPVADPYGIWAHLSSVTASGSGVSFHVSSPFPELPYYLSTVYIVPKAIWDKSPNPMKKVNRHPVGSGPFSFVKYTNGVAIVLKRNPNYFLGPPHVGYLEIKTYSNAESVTLALEKGTVKTTMGTIAMPSLPALLKTKTNHLQRFPSLTNFAVVMNNAVPGLRNVDVRRGIARAINHEEVIVKAELGAEFRPNPGWLPSIFRSYLNTAVYSSPSFRFNIAAAKALITKAGYSFNKAGLAEKNGRVLQLTYYEASGAPAQEKEASMIQGWLRQIGVATKARLVTWPELTSLARTGSYDLVQLGITGPPAPVGMLDAVFSKANTAPVGTPTPGLNYERFVNAKVTTLLGQAAATYNVATREGLVKQVQAIIAKEAPLAVLYNGGGHVVYRTGSFTGYDTSFPVFSPWSLDHVRSRTPTKG